MPSLPVPPTPSAPIDWRTLPAGRELDALIAERVMGWGWMTTDSPMVLPRKRWLAPPEEVGDFGHVRPADMTEPMERPWWLDIDGQHIGPNEWRVPHFSTDMAAAWLLVEKLQGFVSGREFPWWSVAVFYGQPGQVGCRVYACSPGMSIFHTGDPDGWDPAALRRSGVIAQEMADTAPLAICKAALAAVEATR